MTNLESSREYVLSEAKAVIEKIKADPGYCSQAKHINTALSHIVASERNAVMDKALTLRVRPDATSLPNEMH